MFRQFTAQLQQIGSIKIYEAFRNFLHERFLNDDLIMYPVKLERVRFPLNRFPNWYISPISDFLALNHLKIDDFILHRVNRDVSSTNAKLSSSRHGLSVVDSSRWPWKLIAIRFHPELLLRLLLRSRWERRFGRWATVVKCSFFFFFFLSEACVQPSASKISFLRRLEY